MDSYQLELIENIARNIKHMRQDIDIEDKEQVKFLDYANHMQNLIDELRRSAECTN
jgi:hypothetical protein